MRLIVEDLFQCLLQKKFEVSSRVLAEKDKNVQLVINGQLDEG